MQRRNAPANASEDVELQFETMPTDSTTPAVSQRTEHVYRRCSRRNTQGPKEPECGAVTVSVEKYQSMVEAYCQENNRCNALEKERVELVRERDTSEHKISESKEKHADVERQRLRAVNECAVLQERVAFAESQAKKAAKETVKMRTECEALQFQYDDRCFQYEELEAQNASLLCLKDIVEQREIECAGLKNQITKLEATLSDKDTQCMEAEAKYLDLMEQLSKVLAPDPDDHDNSADNPRNWGITVQQLKEFHDDIIEDLESYCEVHGYYESDDNCVYHICCKDPCPFTDHGAPFLDKVPAGAKPTEPLLPNMHTVVSRYIQPCTAKDGKQYALRVNPTGLKINRFVSHTWLEPFHDFVATMTLALEPDDVIWLSGFALKPC